MGQKTHPFGFRLGITKNWVSRWFNMKDYPVWLKEDKLIREYVRKRIERKGQPSGISKIIIERKPKKIKILLRTFLIWASPLWILYVLGHPKERILEKTHLWYFFIISSGLSSE